MTRLWLVPLLLSIGLTGAALGDTPIDQGPSEAAAPPSGRYLLMDPNGRAVTNLGFPGQFQLITFD